MIEVIGIIVGLGVLIIWHELGHFLAALSVGVKPSVFSVGFGRKILGFKIKGVDFRVSVLPLGGYVKFEDEGPAGIPRKFYEKPLWARLWIVFAGPLFSFILGPILAFFIAAFGTGATIYTTRIYRSQTNLLQPGDSVIEVNGKFIRTGGELLQSLLSPGEKVLKVMRGRGVLTIRLKGKYGDSVELRILPVVGKTIEGFPAHNKLKKWDWIAGVDTMNVFSWQQLVEYVQERREGDTVLLTIFRNGRKLTVKVPVKVVNGEGKLGIYVATLRTRTKTLYNVLDETWFLTKRFSLLIFEGISRILKGEVKPQESIGGPITIGVVMAEAASSGWDIWMGILIVITINLALINLLPIPGLDGGHLVFMTLDEVYLRMTGRRIPEKAMVWILAAGVFVIIMIAIFALSVDIHRLITGGFQKIKF